MNARQFFDKVAEMRLMQRAYFKNRDKDTLVECKRLEAEIDAEIHRVEFILKTKDVVGLADLLGHGSVDTTRIYLQKSQEEQKREYNRTITW